MDCNRPVVAPYGARVFLFSLSQARNPQDFTQLKHSRSSDEENLRRFHATSHYGPGPDEGIHTTSNEGFTRSFIDTMAR
jgi:hypothetical protein